MRLATMIDSIRPILPAPLGVDVAAFYLHGHGETRAWTAAEVEEAKLHYKYLLPIYVTYTDFQTPEIDADGALEQCNNLGITFGAVAGDFEQGIMARAHAVNYPLRWNHELSHAGRYGLGYTSRSSVWGIAGMDGKWVGGYDSTAQLEGYEAHQYTDKGGGGAYDVSVIDLDRVPLFSTAPVQKEGFLMALNDQEQEDLKAKVEALYNTIVPVGGHSYLEEVHDALARLEMVFEPAVNQALASFDQNVAWIETALKAITDKVNGLTATPSGTVPAVTLSPEALGQIADSVMTAFAAHFAKVASPPAASS